MAKNNQQEYFTVEIRADFNLGCSVEEEAKLVERIEAGLIKELYKITQDSSIEGTKIPAVSFGLPKAKMTYK